MTSVTVKSNVIALPPYLTRLSPKALNGTAQLPTKRPRLSGLYLRGKCERHGWGQCSTPNLACQFVQIIRTRFADRGIHYSRDRLRKILHVQRRVTSSFKTRKGCTLNVRKASMPETEATPLYAAPALDPKGEPRNSSSEPSDANVVPFGQFKRRNPLIDHNTFPPMLEMG